jgi:hypothetical protein
VYMQQQDYPLDQVRQNKIAPPSPPAQPPALPAPDGDPETEESKTATIGAIAHFARIEAMKRMRHAA